MKYILMGIGLSLGLTLTNGIISYVTTPSAEALDRAAEDANVKRAQLDNDLNQCWLDYPGRTGDVWVACVESAHTRYKSN